MPYSRRTYRKRRYTKKSVPWYNKKYSTSDLARKAFRLAKYTKSLINVEFKHFDSVPSPVINTTGSVTHLSAIGQGDTTETRDGSSVLLKQFSCNMTIAKNVSASFDVQRIMIVQSFSDDVPSIAGVLDVADVQSHRNLSQTKKFRVLMDKTITLDPNFPIKVLRFNQKIFPVKHIQWDTDGVSLKGGHLYLLTLGTNAPATEGVADVRCRLRYLDN